MIQIWFTLLTHLTMKSIFQLKSYEEIPFEWENNEQNKQNNIDNKCSKNNTLIRDRTDGFNEYIT